jgi:hypothetical protein
VPIICEYITKMRVDSTDFELSSHSKVSVELYETDKDQDYGEESP